MTQPNRTLTVFGGAFFFFSNARERQHKRERRDGRNGAPAGRRSALVAAHFAAAAGPVQVVFEFFLDKFPRAQTDVTARVVVHAFVQIEHDFVLFVALIAPVQRTEAKLDVHSVTMIFFPSKRVRYGRQIKSIEKIQTHKPSPIGHNNLALSSLLKQLFDIGSIEKN